MLREEVDPYATVRAWHRGSRRTTVIRSVQYLCYLADPLYLVVAFLDVPCAWCVVRVTCAYGDLHPRFCY